MVESGEDTWKTLYFICDYKFFQIGTCTHMSIIEQPIIPTGGPNNISALQIEIDAMAIPTKHPADMAEAADFAAHFAIDFDSLLVASESCVKAIVNGMYAVRKKQGMAASRQTRTRIIRRHR